VPQAERATLDGVLEQSFTGIYLRHARKTLDEVQAVRAMLLEKEPIGLSMLKLLAKDAGYIYYIAVRPDYRGKGIGSTLLRDAVAYLSSLGATEFYASVGEDNVESNALFKGNGFRRTNYGEVSRRYGVLRALAMYRSMFVVPGEALLVLDNATLLPPRAEKSAPASSSS
jgi:ribosomal protein S18 acetylase RimI-like enzyme